MTLPKFSIVIPTVDRHHLLEKTIAGCLLSPYQNLEVLVSDNFSTPETAKVVESFHADPRVRYVRTTQRLSMPEHWEFAWQQATGDFIIINGDDDGFSPTLIDRLAGITAAFDVGLISWDAGLYYHPDWTLSGANTFIFMTGHSGLMVDVNPQAVFASYAKLEIPLCFPQGTRICFSRRLARRAVEKTGQLFWPPYPDFSAPLLLLGILENERYIYCDILAGYGGRSRDSNAAAWDKENGKAGQSERAANFFDEFQQNDIYPHSALKIRAYCNGHAETLNLLRELQPEVFESYEVDLVNLIANVESEFRGLNIHNPFLGPRERSSFESFLAKQDPALVAEAMALVDSRQLHNSAERWKQKPTSAADDLVYWVRWGEAKMRAVRSCRWNHALFLNMYGKLKARFQSNLWGKLRSRLLHSVGVAAGTRPIRLEYMGRMLKVHCADIRCLDSLDLGREIDAIANRFDHHEWLNLEQFRRGGYLRAVYSSTEASQSPGLIKRPTVAATR